MFIATHNWFVTYNSIKAYNENNIYIKKSKHIIFATTHIWIGSPCLTYSFMITTKVHNYST